MKSFSVGAALAALFATYSGPSEAALCGKGFIELGSHRAFYNERYAGRLAYAPLAETAQQARQAQIFCVFTDAIDYTLPRKPDRIAFVLNNMATIEEPLANPFFVIRFVREGSGSTAVPLELWKSDSDLWNKERARRRKAYYSKAVGDRDAFLKKMSEKTSEFQFESGLNVDIHGTTRPTETASGYSSWEERERFSHPALGADDSLKISTLVFANRHTPPSRNSYKDRMRRVVFEVSPANSSALLIETLGPSGQNPLLSRSYRLSWPRN